MKNTTKILIIEDEVQLAEAYTFLFTKAGYQVKSAPDGAVGLVEAKKMVPDLILLDMMMPKLDGLGFLRRFNTKAHPQIKIILLSNMESKEYEAEAFSLGISRYELKASLSPPELMEIVQKTLID